MEKYYLKHYRTRYFPQTSFYEQGLFIAREMLIYEGVGGKSKWGSYEDSLNVERWKRISNTFILKE